MLLINSLKNVKYRLEKLRHSGGSDVRILYFLNNKDQIFTIKAVYHASIIFKDLKKWLKTINIINKTSRFDACVQKIKHY